MASDAAQIGSNDDYTGVVNLGGGDAGVFHIDPQPLNQLAAYTNLYNKAQYDQRQIDTNAKIAELAKISDISLNDLHGKDKDYLTKKYTDFLNYAADFASKEPANHEEQIKQQLEWQTKFASLNHDYQSGKQRAITYVAHANQIANNTTDAERQDVQLKQLDKAFNDTDITTQLTALPQFKMEDIDVPNPTAQKFDVVGIGANDNEQTTATIYNPTLNSGNADAVVLGLKNAYPKKGTPEYDNLSQNQKDAADQQATVESQGKIWNDMAAPLNEVLKNPAYYDNDGNFKANQFENDNASNSVVMRAYNALKSLDNYSHNKYNQATTGIFDDKNLSFKLPPNVNPNDFKAGFVNFKNGITPGQLVQAGMFSKFTGDTFEKKVTHTGESNDIEKVRLAQQGENYRKSLDIAKDKYIADLPYEKQKAGAVGADGKELDFGNLIYGVNTDPGKETTLLSPDGSTPLKTPDGKSLSGIRINNGVVVDKQGNVLDYTGDVKLPATFFDNSIITEFNKYVGTTKPAADGSMPINAPSKLKLDYGQYTVRMKNGEIQGIQTQTEDGSPGSFVSAQQFQHITLEAGQKAASKYKKADTNYGKVQENTAPSPTSNSIVELSGQINPSTLKLNQSYSINGKTYIWNGKKLKAQ